MPIQEQQYQKQSADTSKLFSYKFNDDIFKKITTIPDGKNHGLVFVLDWSGSMANILEYTLNN